MTAAPSGNAGVSRRLGVDASLSRRWLSGERSVPFADVLAAGPAVAVPMLRRGLARFDGLCPRWDGTLQKLLSNLTGDIARMATILDQLDEDDLTEDALKQLQRLNEYNLKRVEQAGQRINEALDKKRAEKGAER